MEKLVLTGVTCFLYRLHNRPDFWLRRYGVSSSGEEVQTQNEADRRLLGLLWGNGGNLR